MPAALTPTIARKRAGADAARVCDAGAIGQLGLGLGSPLIVAAGFLVLALISLEAARFGSRVAVIWPANALLLAALIRARPAAWPKLIAAALAANLAANLVAGDSAPVALLLASCNMFEAWLAALVLRRLRPEGLEISRPADLAVFAATSVGAALASAWPASIGLELTLGQAVSPNLAAWATADVLGLMIVTPCLLLLTREAMQALRADKRAWLFCGAHVAALFAIFATTGDRLLFLAMPTALMLTVGFERYGAAFALLSTAAVATGFALFGSGPIDLIEGPRSAQVVILQIFLTAATVSLLPIAGVLRQRESALAEATQARDEALRAKENALESRGLTELAEELTGIGYWTADPTSNRVEWSPGMYAIFRRSPDQGPWSQEELAAAIHPDDRQLQASVRAAVWAGELDRYDLEMRFRDDANEERILSVRGGVLRDENGEVIRFLSSYLDVTEERRRAAQLRESEIRYRLLAENSTDVIAIYDSGGVFSFISPAIQNILGYSPEELIGRSGAEFVHPEDVRGLIGAFGSDASGDLGELPKTTIQYRAIRKDGEVVWLEAHPRAILDPLTGALVEFQDTVRDITQRKLIELELEAERRKAEAAAKAKTDFLANMSHELRTPLTAIIGFTGLLGVTGQLGEKERKLVERINAASKTLMMLVNDVLDFTKLEQNAIELEWLQVDPRQAVEDAAALVAVQAESKGLDLRIDIAPDVPDVIQTDPVRLRQIMINLLSNAVKFTDQGWVRIRAETSQDGGLEISVADTGVGIPSEKLAEIFERFTQADVTVTRAYGGTGLGLAICKRLVELMGGEISVHSRMGEGSTFWFRIPKRGIVEVEEGAAQKAAG